MDLVKLAGFCIATTKWHGLHERNTSWSILISLPKLLKRLMENKYTKILMNDTITWRLKYL